jgi:hypothetical protein
MGYSSWGRRKNKNMVNIMETVAIQKDELTKLIKEAVKESIEIEFMKLRTSLLLYISDEEQKDIETLYGKPSSEVVHTTKLEM